MSATGWDSAFWRGIGLGDVVDEGFKRIGNSLVGIVVTNPCVEPLVKKIRCLPKPAFLED